jgi:hypothetical protein
MGNGRGAIHDTARMRVMPLTPEDLYSAARFEPLRDAIAACDPYERTWATTLGVALDAACEVAWAGICGCFESTDSDEVVMRNSWAFAAGNLLPMAVLMRAWARHPPDDPALQRIVYVQAMATRKLVRATRERSWHLLVGGTMKRVCMQAPDKDFHDGLTLRHALAAIGYREHGAYEFELGLHNHFTSVSRHVYQRELKRYVERAPNSPRKYTRKQLTRITDYMWMLLTHDRDVLAAFVRSPETLDLDAIERARKYFADAGERRRRVLSFNVAVRARRAAEAETAAGRLIRHDDGEVRKQSVLYRGLLRALSEPNLTHADRTPLGPLAARVIRKSFPPGRRWQWLFETPDALARLVAAGRYKGDMPPADDHAQIIAAWSRDQVSAVILGGHESWLRAPPNPLTLSECTALASRSKPPGKAWVEALSHAVLRLDAERWLAPVLAASPAHWFMSDVLDSLRNLAAARWFKLLESAPGKVANHAVSLVYRDGLLKLYTPSPDDVIRPLAPVFARRLASYLDALLPSPGKDGTPARPPVHRFGSRSIASEIHAAADAIRRFAAIGERELAAVAGSLAINAASWMARHGRYPALSFALHARWGTRALHLSDLERDTDPERVACVRDELLATPVLASLFDDPATFADPNLRRLTIDAIEIHARRHSPVFLISAIERHQVDGFLVRIAALARCLPGTSRALAQLQMCAMLGTAGVRALAMAFARCDHASAAGRRYDAHYRQYELPKDAGGVRRISVPPPWLKSVQSRILDRIIAPLGQHDAAHGFAQGRSIVSNASQHVGKEVVANCDISACFPSVGWPLVLSVLRRDLGGTLCEGAIGFVVDVCTMGGALPIGAPTSPALLNRVLLETDIRLTRAAALRDCTYSRYADDLTFSGGSTAVGMLAIARQSLSRINLALDERKTAIYRRGRRQMVTGLTVNEQVSVPRRLRRRMRAAVHAVEMGREPQWHREDEPVSSLRGRLAFLMGVNRSQGEALRARLDAALARGRRRDG